jgi:hypothetical protein
LGGNNLQLNLPPCCWYVAVGGDGRFPSHNQRTLLRGTGYGADSGFVSALNAIAKHLVR